MQSFKSCKILFHVFFQETALEIIATPHLHRIMPHVNQKFIRLHSQDKAGWLTDVSLHIWVNIEHFGKLFNVKVYTKKSTLLLKHTDP